MENNPKQTEQKQEKEIDLGIFLTLIVGAFKKVGNAIKSFFFWLGSLMLGLLLFIKRRILWLGLGALVGLGIGVFNYTQSGARYYSTMVIRTNFESSRFLYNKIEFFNSLIKEKRTNDLAQIFGISPANASKLIRFEVEPVNDELQMAKLYRENFLTYRRNSNHLFDTAWTRTLNYTNFKKQLTPFDFPLHEITLQSYQADIYPKIQEGILKISKDNTTLSVIKEARTGFIKEEETLVSRALEGLDTLKAAYVKRIETTQPSSQSTNLVVSQQEFKNPELELFDKELLLKDELEKVMRRTAEEHEIFQIYADFNSVGMRSSALRQSFTKYTSYALLITFIILTLIEFYKVLDRVDKARSVKA